jgi:hypothetical protein
MVGKGCSHEWYGGRSFPTCRGTHNHSETLHAPRVMRNILFSSALIFNLLGISSQDCLVPTMIHFFWQDKLCQGIQVHL